MGCGCTKDSPSQSLTILPFYRKRASSLSSLSHHHSKTSGDPVSIGNISNFPSASNIETQIISSIVEEDIFCGSKTNSCGPNDCPIVYSIDTACMSLFVYNTKSKTWIRKNLAEASLHSISASFVPLNSVQEEVLDHIALLTPIAVSTSTIHFVGTKHFAYNFKFNQFSYRAQRNSVDLCDSTLCRVNHQIYALSGRKVDNSQFSAVCERFDVTTNEWTTIAPLQRPYHLGLACAFLDKHQEQKIMILGGLSASSSDDTKCYLSIYSVASNAWSEVSVSLPKGSPPKMVSLPIFAVSSNEMYITSLHEQRLELLTLDVKQARIKKKRDITPKVDLEDKHIESSFYCKDKFALIVSEESQELLENDLLPQTRKTCVLLVAGGSFSKWDEVTVID